jgi:hypothetical protein
MQGMGAPALNRAPRRHQGLRGDLSPEGALTLFVGVCTSKDIVVNRLNIQ